MTRYYVAISLITCALLAGCDHPRGPVDSASWEPDQQLRREVFMECLRALPAGPQATKYNDWDEVVSQCGQQAYYLSLHKEQK